MPLFLCSIVTELRVLFLVNQNLPEPLASWASGSTRKKRERLDWLSFCASLPVILVPSSIFSKELPLSPLI
jgi:hypothetical protein